MFKTKEIKTQILGEKLRDARLASRMALWQISRKTKIPVNYLKYLEEGNYKDLPADVYIVAYIKKYAEVLNLDSGEILKQFRVERGITANLLRPLKSSKDPSYFIKKPLLLVTPKRAGLVLAIVAIALVFGYFWHQLSYLINPPSIRIVHPVSDFATNKSSIEISGQTEPDTYLTVNGKELYVDNKGYFRGIVSLESGLNLLKIEAKDRFGKTNTVFRRVMVTK